MAGGIKLQWKDRNFSEEQHRIYKSSTPMTLGMLPTPIATLGSNITEYIDYDVIEGNTYYYRISAVRGNDEAVSDELEIFNQASYIRKEWPDLSYNFIGISENFIIRILEHSKKMCENIQNDTVLNKLASFYLK